MSIAYSAEVGSYTLFLDGSGVCVRVDSFRGRGADEESAEDRYLGAQFVAALDVTVPGGLLSLPQVGAQLLLGRVTDGRIALLRTRSVTKFTDFTAENSNGQRPIPPPPPTASRLPPPRMPAPSSPVLPSFAPPPVPSATFLPQEPPDRRPRASVPPNPYAASRPATEPPPAPEIRDSTPPPRRLPKAEDPLRSQVFTLAQLATKDERRPLPTTPPHKRPTIAPRSDRPPPKQGDD
jgi:hypothetical protein